MKTTIRHIEHDNMGHLVREVVFVCGSSEYTEACTERLLTYDAQGRLATEEVRVYDFDEDGIPVDKLPEVEAQEPTHRDQLAEILATEREVDATSRRFMQDMTRAFNAVFAQGIVLKVDSKGIARLFADGDKRNRRDHPRGTEA